MGFFFSKNMHEKNRNFSIFNELRFLAEDMGLEEVRTVQTLKIQGGKASSTFVPGIVPTL